MVQLVEQLVSDLPDGCLRQFLTEVQQSIQITEALVLEVCHDINPSIEVEGVAEELLQFILVDFLDTIYSLLCFIQPTSFEGHALYESL